MQYITFNSIKTSWKNPWNFHFFWSKYTQQKNVSRYFEPKMSVEKFFNFEVFFLEKMPSFCLISCPPSFHGCPLGWAEMAVESRRIHMKYFIKNLFLYWDRSLQEFQRRRFGSIGEGSRASPRPWPREGWEGGPHGPPPHVLQIREGGQGACPLSHRPPWPLYCCDGIVCWESWVKRET